MINHRRESVLAGVWHEYAALFEMIPPGKPLDALREDIRQFGVREPIIVYQGKILDGRNRYMCARDLGLDFPVADFEGTDAEALAFVLSTNLHRRHLTESQRAAVAAKLANMKHGDTARFSQAANLPDERPEVSQAQAADMLNVSERSVRTAKTVLEQGAPELAAAVDKGEVSVSAAAAVAELPKDEQAAIVAEGPKAIKAKAKEVKAAKKADPAPVDPSPDAEPVDPEVAKLRREIGKLTTEAMIDEIIGLRADLADAKAKAKTLRAERDDLKAKLADLTADDQQEVIRRLQVEVKNANNAKWRATEEQGRQQKQIYALNKRVEELQQMGVITL